MDADYIRSLIRAGLVLIAFACAAVIGWAIHLIENERANRIAKRLFLAFGGFAIARLVAAYVDVRFDFEIAWFSTIVTYAFNLWILYCLFRVVMKLREDEYEMTDEGPIPNPKYVNKKRVSSLINEFLDEFDVNRRRTDRLKAEMVAHLSDG